MSRRSVEAGTGTRAGRSRKQEHEQKLKQVRAEAEPAAGTNSAQETTQGQEQ
jgi:hypothetical protein